MAGDATNITSVRSTTDVFMAMDKSLWEPRLTSLLDHDDQQERDCGIVFFDSVAQLLM